MSKPGTLLRLKDLLKSYDGIDTSPAIELIKILIVEFTETIELKGGLEHYSKVKPDWKGSFVFDRSIEFQYNTHNSPVPTYNSYVNTKTGERFSVGDYVEVYCGKGTITKFGTSSSNYVYAHTTISATVFNLNMLEKIPREEYWVHKPTGTKFKIIKSGPTATYNEMKHIGGNIVPGVMGTFPSILLDNSQDWVKI